MAEEIKVNIRKRRKIKKKSISSREIMKVVLWMMIKMKLVFCVKAQAICGSQGVLIVAYIMRFDLQRLNK